MIQRIKRSNFLDFNYNKNKLVLIKTIHTIVWLIFVFAILYIVYAGLFDRVNAFVWICIGAVILEAIVLLINRWRCPLTDIAGKYTSDHSVGFDIFIPNWLAKYNKIIFTSIFVLGLILVLYRVL